MLKRLIAAAALAALLLAGAGHAVPTSWPSVLHNVLASEGGNVDDPADPGGRTSRGVIQREWNAWRTTHRGLPADVWAAPQEEIDVIYHEKYWAHRCIQGDKLPAGLDYTVGDYGVNAGVGRPGIVLRRVLQVNADRCDISDALLAIVVKKDTPALIRAIGAERKRFYANLIAAKPSLGKFRNGWMARADAVQRISLKMAGVVPLGLFGEELDTTPAFGPGKAYVQ